MRVPLSTQGLRTTDARSTVQADASSFGADIARGVGDAAQATQQINARINARRQKLQEERDAADALQAYTRASDALRDRLRGDGGYLHSEGRDAADGYDGASQDVDEIGRVHRDGLSDGASAAYERLWRQRRESALNSAATHAGKQRKAYLKSAAASVAEQSQLDAVESFSNPQVVAEHLERGELAIRAGNAGQPADAVNLEIEKYRSSAALTAITAAVDSGDFESARALQEAFADQFSGDDGASVDGLIERANLVERRQEATDEIYGQFGNDVQAGRAYIRENFSGELEDEVLKDFEGRVKEARVSDADQKEQTLNQAIAAVEGGTPVDDLPISLYRALTDEDRKYLRRRQSGVAAVTDQKALENFYTRFSDPDYGPQGAREYLLENVSRFADSDFRSLLSKASPSASPRERESLLTLNQSVDNFIALTGVTNTKDAAKIKAEVIHQVNQRAQDYEDEHGRAPDDRWRDEQVEILMTEVTLDGKSHRIYETDRVNVDTYRVGGVDYSNKLEIDGIESVDLPAVLRAASEFGEQRPEDLERVYSLTLRALNGEGKDISPDRIEHGVRMLLDNPELLAQEQESEKQELLAEWESLGRVGKASFFGAVGDYVGDTLTNINRSLERQGASQPRSIVEEHITDTASDAEALQAAEAQGIDALIKHKTGLSPDELRRWLKNERG